MPTISETLCLRSTEQHYRVNRATGEIRDIALMTGDREAKGHGIYIDQRTLETGLAAIMEQGGRIRAAIKHPSLLDTINGGTDRVLDFPGYFAEVQIRGNQLVAGRLQFFDTFKADHPREYRRLIELAEKTPDLFGISVEIDGYLSFVDADGSEYSEKPEGDDVHLLYEGMPAFRITDLPTASFVDCPAANDNLFARFSRLLSGKLDIHGLRKIAQSFVEWSEAHQNDKDEPAEALGKTVSATLGEEPVVITYSSDEMAAFDREPFGEMSVISTLRERITDKARLTRALAALAEDAALTADAIEARLTAEDQSAEVVALRAAASTDAGTIDALRLEITCFKQREVDNLTAFDSIVAAKNAAKAEAADWKLKYDAIRESGSAPVNLGNATGTPAASILDRYSALEGDERAEFYRANKSAIWAAKKAARKS